jgi:dihydrofolate reductase / thymidylate synthase
MKFNLIFSRNKQGMIGIYNDLLYKIKDDLQWFQRHTKMGDNHDYRNIVIMGVNTWLSLPDKPLRNRLNIIISNDNSKLFDNMNNENIISFITFEQAIEYIRGIQYHKIFIIGGAAMYRYVLHNYKDKIDCIYETLIHNEFPRKTLKDSQNIKYLNFVIDDSYEKIYHEPCKSEGYIYNNMNKQILTYDFNIYQKKEHINKNEMEYLQLLQKIYSLNNVRQSRNSNVKSSFGEKMTFDLREGFPLLTTKRMGLKTILRELLWFISGSTNNKELQKKKVYIWNQNADKEYLQSRNLDYEEGDLGPIYGFQWRHFGDTYRGINHKYEGGIDQLQYVIDMIKNEPTSRRIILNSWNPCDIDKMSLPPCHVMVQFYIDGEYIDAQLYQRSGDMFLGVPFNIVSYSLLLHIIGKLTNYIPRYLHHVLGDAHIYKSHEKVVKEQLQRVPMKSPDLIVSNISDINHIDEDDFIISNYESYQQLKVDMIV